MTWWVLTSLQNTPGIRTLDVFAHTSHQDHLFIAWAYWKPSRHPIYRTVRGTRRLCGYKYIWDTPGIVEQWQHGDTLHHGFSLSGLSPGSTIWYYLFAPDGPYGTEIQGPLVSVTLRSTMLGARVRNALPQNIPHNVNTDILFSLPDWDEGGFFDPAAPTLLTVPTDGRYLVGACLEMAAGNANGYSLGLFSVALGRVAHHNTGGPNNAGWTLAQHCDTIIQLDAGDAIYLECYQNSGGALNTVAGSMDSPVMFIQYLGAKV